MKKQFFRVKQLADQTFLKADKSEVLNNEELQIADQKVEYLRTAISAISKRIPISGQANDADKRIKKSSEYYLANVFTEQGNRKSEPAGLSQEGCILFQEVLRRCGDVEQNLAREYAEHELQVETLVSKPFQVLLDTDFPNILKQKRNLNKYILDKDSASNRYHSTKKEALKDDMEEADSKVEQNRDSLAHEMFGLLARENEFSSLVLQFLKLQRGYHESALKILEDVIPELEKKIGDSSVRRVFGISLQEHLRVSGKRIAFPLEICIFALSKLGLTEEGLFRIVGSTSRVKRFKSAIDSGCLTELIPEYQDVHVLASTLKLYLRELPEPLLTFHLYNDWIQAMQMQSEAQRLEAVKKLIARLPLENRDNLSFLMQFLAKLSRHPENKMSSMNIAIVIAPNLLWEPNPEANMNMNNCGTINMLVDLFIKEVDVLFPHDLGEFVVLPFALRQEDEISVTSSVVMHHQNHNKETIDFHVSTENIQVSGSPKPNSRKKKPAAPVPPNAGGTIVSKTDQDIGMGSDRMSSSSPASYASGSSTLSRLPKSKDNSTKVKTSVGINTDENSLSLSRRRSFGHEDTTITHNTSKSSTTLDAIVPPAAATTAGVTVTSLVSSIDDAKIVDHKYVTQPAANIQVSKAKPVQHVNAQNCDKNFKTTVTHQVYQQSAPPPEPPPSSSSPKPVAAPRSATSSASAEFAPSASSSEKTSSSNPNAVCRSSSMRGDVMSKSATEIGSCGVGGDAAVQLRRPEALERVSKPEVPARPASLQKRSSTESNLDPTTLQRTQCSLYSVANKQQPSIVSVQKHQPGHDNQIAEKERFLNHHPHHHHHPHHPAPTGLPRCPPATTAATTPTGGAPPLTPTTTTATSTNIENKFGDVNSNCSPGGGGGNPPPPKPGLPPKSMLVRSTERLNVATKSTEKLNADPSEKLNGNNANPLPRASHHVRTRSDGNIIDLTGDHSPSPLLQTPPSPRSLSKPTQPPPPPPIVATANKKPDAPAGDSTDL